jgi:hypothetical protein
MTGGNMTEEMLLCHLELAVETKVIEMVKTAVMMETVTEEMMEKTDRTS